MIDDVDDLRRANPIGPEALERAVAIDRATLIDLLEADSGGRGVRPARRRPRAGLPDRSSSRLGYAGVVAAAAAVLVVALVGLQGLPIGRDTVEPGGQDDPAADRAEIDDTIDGAPATGDDGEATSPVVVSVPDEAPPAEGSVGADDDGAATETPTDEGGQSEGAGAGTSAEDGGAEPTAPTTAPEPDPAPEPEPTPQPVSSGPFDPATDLLSLHYDHAHRDDGLSAMAARELATSFDLEPHVVGGTSAGGPAGDPDGYRRVMGAAWGERWLDARADRADAIVRTVDRWLITLDAGGRVWVAEGSSSDFTAEVLAEVQRHRPGLDTTAAVHVVQHNRQNESGTRTENLRFVKASTSYVRIDDGNSANGTADLHRPSSRFEAAARAGRHAEAWAVAFDYLPATRLDFSDTVEVLHILGVTTDVVADPDDFADRFLG